MTTSSRPHYDFEFVGGITSGGLVLRTGPAELGSDAFRYRLQDLGLARGLLRSLPSLASDFLDVGVAVYVADRLARRSVRGDVRPPEERWHRSIRLVVPVRDPRVWQRTAVADTLHGYLRYITDDDWTVLFVRRDAAPRPSESTPPLLPGEPPDSVLLFSGGLDSLLGLVHLARSGVGRVMPVTASTSPRIGGTVDRVLRALPSDEFRLGDHVLPARLRLHLARSDSAPRLRDECEPSQRARSLMFLACAFAVAVTAELNHVDVLENGIGAIGLPMASDHWGSRATKAMHPKSLALFSELSSLLVDNSFEVRNHGIFETKGQLAERLIDPTIVGAVNATSSCDRATLVGTGQPCGSCSSCIERHVATMKVSSVTTTPIDLDHSEHLAAYRFQAELLREALRTGAWWNFLQAFPEIWDAYCALNVGDGVKTRQRLITLFSFHAVDAGVLHASTVGFTSRRPTAVSRRTEPSARLPLVG